MGPLKAPRWISLTILAILVVILSGAAASADTIHYTIDLSPGEVSVTAAGSFSRVLVGAAGYERIRDEGAPQLPYRVVNVLLPSGERFVGVDFEGGAPVVLATGATVERAGPDITEDGGKGSSRPMAGTYSGATGTYPGSLGRYLGTGYLHGRAIASFAVFPVRVQGEEVQLVPQIEMTIATAPAGAGHTLVRERYREGFRDRVEQLLRGLVVNPELDATYNSAEVVVDEPRGFAPTSYPSLEGSPVDYLIITTDALKGEFQRLADWKTEKGVPTVVRTIEWIAANTRNGVDLQETLRFFVQDAYAKWGITYVLLGGDTDILPPRYALSRFYQGGTELPADMYFACLDGSWNDNHNELWGEQGTTSPYQQYFSIDATSSGQGTSSTLSFSHTINTQYNSMLVVGVGIESNSTLSDEVVSVLYDGVPLTRAVSHGVGSGFRQNVEIWYLQPWDLPGAGTYTIDIQVEGTPSNVCAGAVSVIGTGGQPPEATAANDDGNGGSTTIQTAITTLTQKAWVFDVVGSGNATSFTPQTGQSAFFNEVNTSAGAAGGTTEIVTPGPVTLEWSADSPSNRMSYAAAAFSSYGSVFPDTTDPLDSPDLYAEVYQGRIPFSNATDINTVIDKIIAYESGANPQYADRLVFLAEVLDPPDYPSNPVITKNGADNAELIKATALSGKPLDIVSMYETDGLYSGAVPENVQDVLDTLTSGYNHVCHVGHGFRYNLSVGDKSMVISDVEGLNHPTTPFNLYMLNCTAAAYDFPCFAEAALENPNGGAVSVIGANRSAFPNASEDYMYEYYDLLFQQDVVHIGEAFARSRLPLTPAAESADNIDLFTHYIYTLLADPEMTLHTGPLETLSVTHPDSVTAGSNNILVSVSDSGGARESAVVCMTKGDEDYAVGVTNSSGEVTMGFAPETAGSIQVVVTALNAVLDKSYITVDVPSGANVIYAGMTVDDDEIGGSFGNGDGVVDAGETIDFTLDFANTGSVLSDSAWVTLRSTSPMVTIVDSIAALGAVGNPMSALDPVRVVFDPAISDEAAVEFTLYIEDASLGVWNDGFAKVVHAPDLELIALRLDDTPGNGNGVVEEGETFDFFCEMKNYGTGKASGLSATIQDLSGNFTVTSSMDTYIDLDPFAQSENSSGFRLAENDTTVENQLRLSVTDLFGRTFVDTMELRPPEPPDSLRFDASLGVDRIEVVFEPSQSADVVHYNVYRSSSPGGPYTRANVDPLDHTVYLDAGLAPSTRYYYTATAVDRSGNESPLSGEWFSSTNPPQMPGFPIQLETTTTSDPAVGDIDGDGDNEVVVGNKHVCAWHHDGIEVRDGDGDPQSWGVLNTEGDQFTAAPALAAIDANPGLEIIAADLNTKSVYVFDHNGATLPGWPQVGIDNFRSAPTVADLDGNGDPEIIAVDADGRVYAWNADGSEFVDGDADTSTTGILFITSPPSLFLFSTPSIYDMDGDNMDEVIIGTFADSVWVINGDGSVMPGWPVYIGGDVSGSIPVGDIDDDGQPELLVHSKSSAVYVLNHDGTVLPGWPRFININSPSYFTPSPALADFDFDGKLEIVLVGRTAPNTRLFVIDYMGNDLPGWPIIIMDKPGEYTECSPVVGDIDGDGQLDIVLGDEARRVRAWDADGNLKDGFPITRDDGVRATPMLDDVDQDGDIDMVLYSWDKQLNVYDLPGAYYPDLVPWGTYQGNVRRNGNVGNSMPTGIREASFTFSVSAGRVDLAWKLGAGLDEHFEISRAVVDNTTPGTYEVISPSYGVSPDGMLRYHDGGVEMGRRYSYRLVSEKDANDVFTTQPIYVPITRAELGQNYPNPFNPVTRIVYYVPDGAQEDVSLVVYDVRGARVRTLVEGVKTAGRYEVEWDGRNDAGAQVSSGVYFYRLVQPGFTDTKKMVLVK